MKAFVRNWYGGPEVLKLKEVETPQPSGKQVLIKVHALSINPAEWHILRGKIWLIRWMNGFFFPKHSILGGDVAGEVVAVGRKVKDLKVGDRIFGRADHSALAEFALLEEAKASVIPKQLSYGQAASLPLVSITAISSLEQGSGVNAKSTVLIHGASGGIGTMAVQIAKARGAKVHAICSAKKTGFVRSIGADKVINYEEENFLCSKHRYDLVIDLVGNLPLKKALATIKEQGTYVMVGYSNFKYLSQFVLQSVLKTGSHKLVVIGAKVSSQGLQQVGELVSSGTIYPLVDRIFPFVTIPEAFEYLGSRKAKGKVVIKLTREL